MKEWNIFHASFIFGGAVWILDFLFKMSDRNASFNEIAGYALVLYTSLVFAVLLWKAVDKWNDGKAQAVSTSRYTYFHNIIIVLIMFEWVFCYIIAGNSVGIYQHSIPASSIIILTLIGIAVITICTAIYIKIFRKA